MLRVKVETIRLLMELRDWDQKRLSEESGVKRSHLSLILSGNRNPKLESLHKLSKALDVSITKLYEEINEEGEV